MRLMAILLSILAVSLAIATFIENDHGTVAARATVYNAWWFEGLLGLLVINLTGNIILRKLYEKRKFTIFLFHIAFSFILIGGFITRFFGEEGYMHIREGNQSDLIITDHKYLSIEAKHGNNHFHYSKPVLFSAVSSKIFTKNFYANNQKITLKSIGYIPNATHSLVPSENGNPVLELITHAEHGRKSIFMEPGDTNKIGQFSVSFYNPLTSSDIRIYEKGGELVIQSRYQLEITDKDTWTESILDTNMVYPFNDKTLYKIEGIIFVLKEYLSAGQLLLLPGNELNVQEEGLDALILEANSANTNKEFIVWGKQHVIGEEHHFVFEGFDFTVTYGAKVKQIPFSLKLEEFRVDRYPGSNSPSFFESEVILIDAENNLYDQRNIFMNNVLKYRGYRFYQASYDPDEKGTILSVNKDYSGTFFTYLGYLMLTLGMILSLANKNSRFRKLQKASYSSALVLMLFLTPVLVNASETSWEDELAGNIINPGHAARFGELLVQDNSGRIKPLNTLSSQILRKITRQNQFMGLSSDQVILGMIFNPEFWQLVPLIKISHTGIKEILNTEADYISFSEIVFNNPSKTYLLGPFVEEAYRKKPAYRTKFDNEIIRVDERVNICFVVYTTSLLKLFPDPHNTEDKWYSPRESPEILSEDDSVFVSTIMALYYGETGNSIESGDWSKPDEYLNYISLFQQKHGGHILPSESKRKMEILYNRLDIFNNLSKLYGITGFVLLVLHFIGILSRIHIPRLIHKPGGYMIILLFTIHTIGLIIRWYVAGHAPWSNGYEALTYISWATVLSGIIFHKKSPVTLSATAIMAFLILHVAHLSWMDPEITSLAPVLKSVWLVIHVSIITASYGFFSLGALLALLNLILMNFRTRKNITLIDRDIEKLTGIIEMTLIVGLYLMTIGTFLGGVWANESWGRYWGWDPKETWALITILVYAFIAHMRMIPGLQGTFTFNLMALFGFSSVIMTFFGVNYYLSGLHSYAAGDPLPVPDFVYYTITILSVISISAFFNRSNHARSDRSISSLQSVNQVNDK
jgi:cytochrome c-type biogenesis protein CcsB